MIEGNFLIVVVIFIVIRMVKLDLEICIVIEEIIEFLGVFYCLISFFFIFLEDDDDEDIMI